MNDVWIELFSSIMLSVTSGFTAPGHFLLRQALDQVARLVREVAVVRAHQLQLELDAEAQALRRG